MHTQLPPRPARAELSFPSVAVLAVRGAPPLVLRLERVGAKPRLFGKVHPLGREEAGNYRIVGGLGALIPLLRADVVLPARAQQVSVGPRRGCRAGAAAGATSVRILQKRWDWLHAAVRARDEHCCETAMRAFGWLCVPSFVEWCRCVCLFLAFEAGARFGVVAAHARPRNGRSGTDG